MAKIRSEGLQMDSLEKRLEEKLNYLYDMARKYNDLNKKTRGKYNWRENAIYEQIQALEELKENKKLGNFDDCYEEDLSETEK